MNYNNFIYFTPSYDRALEEAKSAAAGFQLKLNPSPLFIALEFDTAKLGDARIYLLEFGDIRQPEVGMYVTKQDVPLWTLTNDSKKEILLQFWRMKEMGLQGFYPETDKDKNRIAHALGFESWKKLVDELGIK